MVTRSQPTPKYGAPGGSKWKQVAGVAAVTAGLPAIGLSLALSAAPAQAWPDFDMPQFTMPPIPAGPPTPVITMPPGWLDPDPDPVPTPTASTPPAPTPTPSGSSGGQSGGSNSGHRSNAGGSQPDAQADQPGSNLALGGGIVTDDALSAPSADRGIPLLMVVGVGLMALASLAVVGWHLVRGRGQAARPGG